MSEETRGQRCRKNIRETIEHNLSKYVPNSFNSIAYRIAYDYNLSPDTIKYGYLPMWIEIGILEIQDGKGKDYVYDLSAMGKGLQTTEDGLTEEQLREELEEENEQRNKLGKPRVSLEEWKEKRSKRLKPVK
jgi:hypothetical protein